MNSRPSLSLAILCFFIPTIALCQIPGSSIDIANGEIKASSAHVLDDWATLYFSGLEGWAKLQESVKSELENHPLVAHGTSDSLLKFDFKQNYYSIVFSTNKRSEDGEELRFFVHTPDPEPYTQRLPGEKTFFEVFISNTPTARLETSLMATRVQDPIIDKLPSFVSKQFDLSKIAGIFTLAGPSSEPLLYAHVSELRIPFTRASISIEDRITAFKAPDKDKINTSASRLAATREARLTRCTQVTAIALQERVARALEGDKSKQPIEKQWKDLKDALDQGLDAAMSEPSCTNNSTAALSDRVLEGQAITSISKQFLDLIAMPKPTEIKGKFSYENQPRERFSLGVLSGVIVSAHGSDTRAKVSNGKLIEDELKGSISMGILNIHPVKYDPKSQNLSPAERFRFFVGASFNPEFGIGGGVGVSLVRGLAVNLGYAALRVDSPSHGLKLGDSVEGKKNIFRNGRKQVAFLALSFNF